MSQEVWLLLMLAPWAVGLILYRRYRPRTRGFAERTLFQARTPQWLKNTERFVMLVIWVGLTLMLLKGFTDLHRVIHGDAGMARPGRTASITMALGAFLAPAGPALLAANLIAWLVPPLRRANLIAMEGLPTTRLARANLDLLTLTAATAPLALAEAFAGAFEPWAGR